MKKIIKPNQNNPEAKKKQVTHMFDGISKSYDLLNRIITLGIDVIWRKRVVRLLKKEAPDTILDIATGTGDLVLALAKLNAKKIIGLDISPGMLEIGKKKVLAQNLTDRIKMQLGDSEALHYEDNSFAAVTVAFGVRNFENLDKGLLEIFRVLKPKGTLVILETAVPKNIMYIPVEVATLGGTPTERSRGLKIAPPPNPSAPATQPPTMLKNSSLNKVVP